MKPIDCKNMVDGEKMDAVGLKYNEQGIRIIPGGSVAIYHEHYGSFTVSKNLFDRYVAWYTSEQPPNKFKSPNIPNEFKNIDILDEHKKLKDELDTKNEKIDDLEMIVEKLEDEIVECKNGR